MYDALPQKSYQENGAAADVFPAMKKSGSLGIGESFALVGATVAENFGVSMPESTIGQFVFLRLK